MSDENRITTRRDVLRGMTTGLIASIAAPAAAGQNGAASAAAPAGGDPNTVTAYLRPPFPPQQQP